MNPLDKVIELVFEANAQDPNQELWQGKQQPKELLYSQRMLKCLSEFEPEASDCLHIAVAAQHICRWQVPRSDYPMNKQGYYAWRTGLYQFHAQKVSEFMRQSGYRDEDCARVAELMGKRKIKQDEQAQVFEDVICLVFLEYYFEDFAKPHEEAKVIDIVQKTWKKMSDRGHQWALKLPLSAWSQELIGKALQ